MARRRASCVRSARAVCATRRGASPWWARRALAACLEGRLRTSLRPTLARCAPAKLRGAHGRRCASCVPSCVCSKRGGLTALAAGRAGGARGRAARRAGGGGRGASAAAGRGARAALRARRGPRIGGRRCGRHCAAALPVRAAGVRGRAAAGRIRVGRRRAGRPGAPLANPGAPWSTLARRRRRRQPARRAWARRVFPGGVAVWARLWRGRLRAGRPPACARPARGRRCVDTSATDDASTAQRPPHPPAACQGLLACRPVYSFLFCPARRARPAPEAQRPAIMERQAAACVRALSGAPAPR